MVKDEQINVPSLTAYKDIENSRAHVYNDFDNQINIFAEKYEIIKILNYQIIKLVSRLSKLVTI